VALDATHRPRLGTLDCQRERGDLLGRLRFVVSVAVLAVALEVVYIVFTSPRFAVREIELRGDPRVTEEAAPRLHLPANSNLLRVRPELLAQRVEAVPSVREARVTRDFPNRLIVAVQRREAVAVIRNSERALLIDPEGVVFTVRDDWGWGLPELAAPHLAASRAVSGEAAAELAALLKVLWALGPDPRLRATRLELRPEAGVELVLDSGATVRFGDPVQLTAKARLLAAVLDELGEDRIGYLDLSDPPTTYWSEREDAGSSPMR